MNRFFLVALVLGCMTIAQVSLANANAATDDGLQSTLTWQSRPGDKGALPPPPRGKSTVEGGRIRNVDPVRDQLTLDIYGAKPMKILFDARTQVFRDGKRIPLRDLAPVNHASVETVLDGTRIFALSIHTLSQPPQGDTDGQVVSYDATTGELKMTAALSRQPIQLRVPAGTPIAGVGQVASSLSGAGLSNLVPGTLISVKFESGKNGRGIARQISIVATPGSYFVFSGDVTFLNLSSRKLALVDPRDNRTYQISFDPERFPMSRNIHVGTHLVVHADFDGSRYVASAIKIN